MAVKGDGAGRGVLKKHSILRASLNRNYRAAGQADNGGYGAAWGGGALENRKIKVQVGRGAAALNRCKRRMGLGGGAGERNGRKQGLRERVGSKR